MREKPGKKARASRNKKAADLPVKNSKGRTVKGGLESPPVGEFGQPIRIAFPGQGYVSPDRQSAKTPFTQRVTPSESQQPVILPGGGVGGLV